MCLVKTLVVISTPTPQQPSYGVIWAVDTTGVPYSDSPHKCRRVHTAREAEGITIVNHRIGTDPPHCCGERIGRHSRMMTESSLFCRCFAMMMMTTDYSRNADGEEENDEAGNIGAVEEDGGESIYFTVS